MTCLVPPGPVGPIFWSPVHERPINNSVRMSIYQDSFYDVKVSAKPFLGIQTG